MSKIFDALQKAAGEDPGKEPEAGAPAPASPEPEMPAPPHESPADAPLPDLEHPSPLEETFARELATLRASLDRRLPTTTPRTILFTGSVPGEGCSTVVSRYAQFLAEDPALTVALVDADLRNQDARPIPPAAAGRGLAGVLAGTTPWSQVIHATPVPRLHVLPSEGSAAEAYRLLTGDRMPAVLEGMRRRFPVTLIDAAPVLAAPETAVLAGKVDGVVLVVRASRTKRQVVKKAMEQLHQYAAPVLGVVMNRQRFAIPEFLYRRL